MNKINKLINQITAVLVGILLASSFFAGMMKLLNITGAVLALLIAFALHFFLLKKRPFKSPHLKLAEKGFFAFSVFFAIAGTIILAFSYFALQNLLN